MSRAKWLSGLSVLVFLSGRLGVELGLTQEVIEVSVTLSDPRNTGGFWDALNTVLIPIGYGFNTVASFFQLMSFQIAGAPPLVESVVSILLTTMTGYILYRAIRSG